MSEFLRKIGHYSFSHPWQVLAIWIGVLVMFGGLALMFIKPTDPSISIPGTEAQIAIDRVEELFAEGSVGSGRVVLKTEGGESVMEYSEAINGLASNLGEIDGISTVVAPGMMPDLVSSRGDIAFLQVQLENATAETSPEVFEAIDAEISSTEIEGLQVEKSMSLSNLAPEDILGVGEVVGVAVAFVVLLITLGSLVSAGMPILSALLGVGVSMAGLFAMSELITIGSTTPVLAIMLGLAVGIDYALFIVNRYKNLLTSGHSYDDAIKIAIGTAGNAVVFAALTVVIALAALSVVQIPFMTIMGLAGAASVAIAAIAAVTFIPALLGFAKGRIFRPASRKEVELVQAKKHKKVEKVDKGTVWYRWVTLVTRYPLRTLTVSLVAVAVLAYPVFDMKLGLPTDQFAEEGSTHRKAYDILSEGFGVGFNGPLTIIVEGLEPLDVESIPGVTDAMPGDLGVSVDQMPSSDPSGDNLEVVAPTPGLSPEEIDATSDAVMPQSLELSEEDQAGQLAMQEMALMQAQLAPAQAVAQKLLSIPGSSQALAVGVSDDGEAGLIQVIPESAPTSDATMRLIEDLRSETLQDDIGLDESISIAVTGATALELDVSDKLASALPIYLIVVVGLSLIILVLAFRSIWVPVKATLGFLASVLVMFGSIVAVFQWGWFGLADAPGQIVSFIPIIAIGILFGLAMDYEFFLVSSMREAYSRGKGARDSVVLGFSQSGRVVAAAAIIMVSVFAGFVTSHDSTIQAMGFGLAVGIFFDAFIVRMTMVPALMSLLGDKAWWLPKWLDKRLPHISIEGKE